MARGTAKSAQNTAANIEQQSKQQQLASQSLANQQQNAMMPEIQAEMSPGGDPAVTAATMGSLSSTMGANQAQAMDAAARTRNAASTNATLENLGRTQGQLAARTAAENVMNQHQQGMAQLAKLFGINENEFNKMLETRLAANQQYAANAPKSSLGPIMSGVGSAIGAFAGA